MKYLFKMPVKTILLFLFCLIMIPNASFGKDTLKLLIWEGYSPPEQIKIFKALIKKKYGKEIELEISHNISGIQDFYDAIRTNSEEKLYHIISPAHNFIKDSRFGCIRNKLIMPVNLQNIPNYKKIIPQLQKADYITDDKGNVYGVPMAHGPYGLAYNTKYFKSPPTSWNIFGNPEYKNRYTISSDYYEANVYIVALSAGLRGEDLYNYQKLRQNNITSRIEVLARNAHSFWDSVDTADDLQGLALATSWGFSFNELRRRGEVWKMVEPVEGTTGWVDNFLMSSKLKKNPFLKTVAEEWMNFALSPDYQVNVVVRQLMSDPVNLMIKNRLTREEVEHHHLDDPNYFHEKRWLWPVFKSKRERNALKKIWYDATKSLKQKDEKKI
ncbi:MAG: extracellular solute-binding protein [Desulfobacteraceae bacterium]|nr:extracellular solute-binding protein [Desulfobacteraceae bacterium]